MGQPYQIPPWLVKYIIASESEANGAVTKAIPFWRGRLAGGVVVFDGAHQGVDVLKGE